MNLFGQHPTGRENRIIHYCPRCGSQEEPEELPLQSVGSRPCQDYGHPAYFVSYEEGIENDAAQQAIDQHKLCYVAPR